MNTNPTINPDHVQSFSVSMRRVIRLSVLLDNAAEYLLMEPETDSRVASKCVDIRVGIRKLFQFMQTASHKAWPELEKEMASDQLQDSLLLLDETTDVDNVGEIVELIKKWKAELIESKKQG